MGEMRRLRIECRLGFHGIHAGHRAYGLRPAGMPLTTGTFRAYLSL